jgi:energy-coupling factor transport system substrate-specific component
MILKKAEEAGINTKVALRYVLAGGTATGINFLSRFPLSQVLPFEWAVLGAQAIGFAAGFLFYRTWVFRDAGTRLPRQLTAFLGVNLFSTAIVLSAALMLRGLFLGLELPLWIAEAMAHAGGIACGTVFNFLGHRMLTFARRQAV